MQVISHGDEQHSLQVILTVPSVIFSDSALQAVLKDEQQCNAAKAWLASRDPDILSEEVAANSRVLLHLDGHAYTLTAEKDFFLPIGSLGKLKSQRT